jgi:hypothetical protein
MAFPGDINALVSVNSSDSLATAGHAARHNEVKTALEGVRDAINGKMAYGASMSSTWTAAASTSPQDITGMSLSATAPSGSSKLLAIAKLQSSFTSGGNTNLYLYANSTPFGNSYFGSSEKITSTVFFGLTSVTPGTSYTVKVQYVNDIGSAAAFFGAGGNEQYRSGLIAIFF